MTSFPLDKSLLYALKSYLIADVILKVGPKFDTWELD